MIVDANFLLRLLTRHTEPMYQAARAFALEAERRGLALEVHPIHVAEVVYVLEGRLYGLSPREVARELLALLSARPFVPREEEALRGALEAYPESGLDFPDLFLAELARAEGKPVVSFDRKIRRTGVKLIVPKGQTWTDLGPKP
jgi:predicted nucleic acid-binding protein